MMPNLLKLVLPFLVFFELAFLAIPSWAVSLEEEIKLGKEEHAKILGRFGIYQDQDLQAYINLSLIHI